MTQQHTFIPGMLVDLYLMRMFSYSTYEIWFAWIDACIRCLKDLSTGGILLLKEYSKGLDFDAA